MSNIKSVIRVRCSKIFEYPKSILQKNNEIAEALNLARSDMQIFIEEVYDRDRSTINNSMFVYEAEEDLGYKYKKPLIIENKSIKLEKVIKVLAVNDIESKVGALNPEINPNLFDYYAEQRTEDGLVVTREEFWQLKDKIENDLFHRKDYYYKLLINVK